MDSKTFQNNGFPGYTGKQLTNSKRSYWPAKNCPTSSHGTLRNFAGKISDVLPKFIVCLALIGFCGCREQILHNLTETEVNRVVTGLEGIGILAVRDRQADGRWLIAVQASDTVSALRYVEAHRLLRAGRPVLEDANSSILESREQQRFDFERKLSVEIESTLSAIDGVLEARVHLNVPAVDPLFGQQNNKDKGSASVLLIVGGEYAAQSTDIAAVVAGASGVAREAVVVFVSKSDDGTDRIVHSADADGHHIVADAKVKETSNAAPDGIATEFTAVFENRRLIEVTVSLFIIGAGLLVVSRAKRNQIVPSFVR